MEKPRPVTPEQVNEWLEGPVAQRFLYLTIIEREETLAAKGLDAFCPFDAQKTQELLANLNGYVDALDRQIAALQGEGFLNEDSE